MILILDRIEDGIAVFENPETQILSKFREDELPPNAKEGDVYKYDEETHNLKFDEKKTEERRQKISDLAKSIFCAE